MDIPQWNPVEPAAQSQLVVSRVERLFTPPTCTVYSHGGGGGGHFTRCLIDGIWQMSNSFTQHSSFCCSVTLLIVHKIIKT